MTSSKTFAEQMARRERERSRSHDYLAYHSRRFEYVLEKCKALKPSPDTRVLDVGRSQLSVMLRSHYRRVATLGFEPIDNLAFGHEDGLADLTGTVGLNQHIVFDLNDAQHVDRIECEQIFDLIVFAEVLEHLYTAPELVLHLLRAMLSPEGVIVCQTPNAAALHKRIQLLFGYNPYERLRCDHRNPGHFREYTKRELMEIGELAELRVVEHSYVDYFGAEGSLARRIAIRAMRALTMIVPAFARGQTVVYGR